MSKTVNSIIEQITELATQQSQAEKSGLLTQVRTVQDWQSKRLLATHQAMYQQKQYRPAMQFFVDEIYAAKDFSQRDQDIARVVPKMAQLLPEKALKSVETAARLNRLSFELDQGIAENLREQSCNRQTYAAAYQACNNQAARERQLDFIGSLGSDLADVVGIRGISMLLRFSRGPAKMAGLLSLHEFIERGFKAFKKLGDVDDFIQPILHTEKRIMTELFSQQADNPLPADSEIK